MFGHSDEQLRIWVEGDAAPRRKRLGMLRERIREYGLPDLIVDATLDQEPEDSDRQHVEQEDEDLT